MLLQLYEDWAHSITTWTRRGIIWLWYPCLNLMASSEGGDGCTIDSFSLKYVRKFELPERNQVFPQNASIAI